MSDPSVFVLQTSNSPRPVTQTSKSTRPVTQTSNSTHLVSQESYSTFILSWSPHPSSSMSQPSNPLLLSEPNVNQNEIGPNPSVASPFKANYYWLIVIFFLN
ncbi:unnamed protein product [Rotaria sordida]|uniref:Uncharacterized protein n=1 Tax=Rotaria sordida TaxID=392033 RepID=A0A814P4K1_9BILA|nr:unnamed protein product [Rotaria sordida]CAF1102431.1 unnamed protein product [Rotaria sordida]